MNFDFIKTFVKTKKGKTAIGTAIGGLVLFFFPENIDMIGDIMTAACDKVQPENLGE